MLERVGSFALGSAETAAADGIERDEVDVAEHAFKQRSQSLGVRRGIVLPLYKSIFEADAAAGLFAVRPAGRDELRERVALRDRHQGLALCLISLVKRDGQIDLGEFVAEAFDERDEAAGRDGNIAVAEIRSLRVVDGPEEGCDLFVIVEGLAYAHEDYVVDVPCLAAADEELVEDLPGLEIADPAVLRGGAEPAAHAAADLSRYAQRVAVFVSHEYGFYLVAVGEPEKELAGAVRGGLDEFGSKAREGVVLRKSASEIFGKVEHLIEAFGSFEYPFAYLPGPEGRRAESL